MFHLSFLLFCCNQLPVILLWTHVISVERYKDQSEKQEGKADRQDHVDQSGLQNFYQARLSILHIWNRFWKFLESGPPEGCITAYLPYPSLILAVDCRFDLILEFLSVLH